MIISILDVSLQTDNINREYINHLEGENTYKCFKLYKDNKNKASISLMKECLNDIKEELIESNSDYIICTDGDYFKLLTGNKKVDACLGYLYPIALFESKGLVTYVPSYKRIFYDPDKIRNQIARGIGAINAHIHGSYLAPGTNVIHNALYPDNLDDVSSVLDSLLSKPFLSCDIETWSLRPHLAGITSISFAWGLGEGTAFLVDNSRTSPSIYKRAALKKFFENYRGNLIFHNAAFDITVLIYQLWMNDITDTEGLLKGLGYMTRSFDDTKIIAYLATNSCSGNELGLKSLSQEYAGNYAQEEIENVDKIPTKELLKYNLIDTSSTLYVYNKYYPVMVKDNQLDIYQDLFKPALVDIIQMQLTGFPLSMDRVKEVKEQLLKEQQTALDTLNSSKIIKDFVNVLNEDWVERKNATLKKKKVTIEDANETFNPRSGLQLRELLYTTLGLPVLNKTDTKQPSVDGKTLEALLNHTNSQDVKDVLQALLDYSAVDKILTAFIPTFENAVPSKDGWHYLIGNFNLGGTVSGRLSSSNPNLQQIPATGSKYAKLIKSCFVAPKGWILCGLDFNALEDHISALTTKDHNKLKVYTEGYDGHCLRAYSYWKDLMPDITEALEKNPEKEVEIINSIKTTHKDLRQRSKGCTFALTYSGTFRTLIKNFGFSEPEALHIEKQYHELYKESDEWVKSKMEQAAKDGYVTVAFGLRVRTPVMHQCILGLRNTPKEAEAEKRTAGNALGQSYGLLNSRAGVEFNSKVRNSKFRLNIRPCAQIHDAQYFLIKDDIETILWANTNLVKAVEWQLDPAIAHDQVKLGGEFSIFFPDWAHEMTVPNIITKEGLITLSTDYIKSLN